MKAPIKSAWCCKSLVWFGACKPLESHWLARAKCAVRERRGGWGYVVRLALYLMHHLSLRCWFNRQRPNNEVTFLDSHANWQSERESWVMAPSALRRKKTNSCRPRFKPCSTCKTDCSSTRYTCSRAPTQTRVTATAGIIYTNSQVM